MAFSPSSLNHRTARVGRRRPCRDRRHRSRVDSVFVGIALAVVGVVAWGFQQRQDWAEPLLDWWPLILVWTGLGKLLSRRFVPGIALITGGGLAFLHLRGLADFDYTWPLILVAVGVVITIGALMSDADPASDAADVDAPDLDSGDRS
jgi:hypothetical protein